jgi:hypothetical protein
MRPNKPNKLDTLDPDATQTGNRYLNANRDRVLGEADRTGRHFDENAAAPDDGAAASEDHEAD